MNIMGIPVVQYEQCMGWYDKEKADALTKKITVVNSSEEQLKNICIRQSSRYKDGFMQCEHIYTFFEIIRNNELMRLHISEFVADNNKTIIGINIDRNNAKEYLLIGANTAHIDESLINDFWGIEVGDDIFELVDSETQRINCQNCDVCFKRNCNPWYKNTYLKDFGHTPNDKELLSWELMEITGKNYSIARLIASKCIAVVPFSCPSNPQELYKQLFYEDSYIKKWLSKVFIREFFNEQEREKIISVSIPNIHQMEKWFPEEIDRICKPTKFSIDNGASVFNNHMNSVSCTYWLSDTGRKPGYSSTVVLSNGKIYKSAYMSAHNVCVRPVIDIIRKE